MSTYIYINRIFPSTFLSMFLTPQNIPCFKNGRYGQNRTSFWVISIEFLITSKMQRWFVFQHTKSIPCLKNGGLKIILWPKSYLFLRYFQCFYYLKSANVVCFSSLRLFCFDQCSIIDNIFLEGISFRCSNQTSLLVIIMGQVLLSFVYLLWIYRVCVLFLLSIVFIDNKFTVALVGFIYFDWLTDKHVIAFI